MLYFDIKILLNILKLKIFERVLTQIAPVVREEQLFCVNFFNFIEEETISGDVSYDLHSFFFIFIFNI